MTEIDLLRAMLSSPMSVAVAVTDTAGRLLSFNATAAQLFGLNEHMKGSSDPALFAWDGCSADQLAQEMRDALARGERCATRRYHPPATAARWIETRLLPVHDGAGIHIGFLRFAQDVTEQRVREQATRREAHSDQLTGLYNRHAFNERLREALARHRRGNSPLVLHLLDLDLFKEVNDTLGHAAGDQVLRSAAERINAATRSSDIVARLGGDEFAVLQTGLDVPVDASLLAGKLVEKFRQPFSIGDRTVFISASIGIAIAGQDGWSSGELLRKADMALYRAKRDGRNGYAYFTPELDEQARAFTRDMSALRAAVAAKQFHLMYQPIVRADGGALHSFEALLRCDHPALRGRPIPALLDTMRKGGLMSEMSQWIVHQLCEDISHAGPPGERHPVSLNLCARELSDFGMVEMIERAMRDNGVQARDMSIELTEHALFESAEVGREIIGTLSERGLSVALDDFGTGYSSLSYLTSLPIDVIKLDLSFVRPLPGDAQMCKVVSAIIQLAHALDIKVIAEGVESAAQYEFLRAEGCDTMQGYLLSRPVTARQMRRL